MVLLGFHQIPSRCQLALVGRLPQWETETIHMRGVRDRRSHVTLTTSMQDSYLGAEILDVTQG